MRWGEEVELLQEEMGRVLRFLDWKARWWVDQEKRRGDTIDTGLREGLSAYAHHQSSIRVRMKENFAFMWRSVDLWVKSGELINAGDEEHLEEIVEDEEAVGQKDSVLRDR